MHGISPGLFPLPSDFIKFASCICISGTKSQHLHPRVTCHFLVCANERKTVQWQYVHAALFTCLYFARFLLIQGNPTFPDALEVSCAYYYSAMFRYILKLTVLLCRGNFCYGELQYVYVCLWVCVSWYYVLWYQHASPYKTYASFHFQIYLFVHLSRSLSAAIEVSVNLFLFWSNFFNLLMTCANVLKISSELNSMCASMCTIRFH